MAPTSRRRASQMVKQTVKNNFLFRHLDSVQFGELMDAMFRKEYEPGDDIIVQARPPPRSATHAGRPPTRARVMRGESTASRRTGRVLGVTSWARARVASGLNKGYARRQQEFMGYEVGRTRYGSMEV